MKKIRLEDLKFLYLPFFILSLITILFIISFRIFANRVNNDNTKLNQAQTQQAVLAKKLDALEHIGNVVNEVQSISFALPGENPAFIEVSQIKRYAQALGLNINSIQIGQETQESSGIMHATVNFEIEGNPIVMFSLMDKLKNASPLTVANNIDISQKGGVTLSTFTLSVYWSAFPEKLPALGEPVSELSPGDGEILSKILTLDMPVLGSISPTGTESAAPNIPRTNPFGF